MEYRNFDTELKSVDKDHLTDIQSVTIDPKLSKQERIRSFVRQVGNPYCYRDGDVVVGIRYADTEITLEDRLKAYATGLS